MKRLKNQNGSTLISVILLTGVLVILCGGLLAAVNGSTNQNLRFSDTEQAYLNAKSGMNAVASYYENDDNEERLKLRQQELVTLASGGTYTGTITNDEGDEKGTYSMEFINNERIISEDEKYVDVTVKITGECGDAQSTLYKEITVKLDEEEEPEPEPPRSKTPFFDNALTCVGNAEGLVFQGGVIGDIFMMGEDGLSIALDSQVEDFRTNGSYTTLNGSQVDALSLVTGGYVCMVKTEEVAGNVIAVKWITVGGEGANWVYGSVYSQTGVTIASSGQVGTEGVTDKKAILSEGPVYMYGSNVQKENVTIDGSSYQLVKVDEDTGEPVLGSGRTAGCVAYGDVVAKGDVHISCTPLAGAYVVNGDVYSQGDVYLESANISGNVYAAGDVYVDNSATNMSVMVANIYAGGNIYITTPNGNFTYSNCYDGADLDAAVGMDFDSVFDFSSESASAEAILQEEMEKNEMPDAIVVPEPIASHL